MVFGTCSHVWRKHLLYKCAKYFCIMSMELHDTVSKPLCENRPLFLLEVNLNHLLINTCWMFIVYKVLCWVYLRYKICVCISYRHIIIYRAYFCSHRVYTLMGRYKDIHRMTWEACPAKCLKGNLGHGTYAVGETLFTSHMKDICFHNKTKLLSITLIYFFQTHRFLWVEF